MADLNNATSVVFLIMAGRAFHSRGSAIEKALSPNFVLVRDISSLLVIAVGADRGQEASSSCTCGWTNAIVVIDRYITRQSL